MNIDKQERWKPLLDMISKTEDTLNIEIRAEGHTDDKPIPMNSKFRNNWELSSARATNIATFLVKGMKYVEGSVSIRAFSSFKPKIPYTDKYGRSLRGNVLKTARQINRRVEIILVDKPKGLAETRVLFDGS